MTRIATSWGRREALGTFLSSFLLVALAREARGAAPPGEARRAALDRRPAGDRRSARPAAALRPPMGAGGRAARRRDRRRRADGGGEPVAAPLGRRAASTTIRRSASSASSARMASRAGSLMAPPCSTSRRTMSSPRTAIATWSRPTRRRRPLPGAQFRPARRRGGRDAAPADARLCCADRAGLDDVQRARQHPLVRAAGRPGDHVRSSSSPASTPARPTMSSRRSIRSARRRAGDGSLIAPIIGFAESSRLYTASI